MQEVRIEPVDRSVRRIIIYNTDCPYGTVLSGFKLFDKDNNLLLETLYEDFING